MEERRDVLECLWHNACREIWRKPIAVATRQGERSGGAVSAGPAIRPAMGVGLGGWPQATCKDNDTSSSYCGRASCAPEKRTARPQDGSKHLAAERRDNELRRDRPCGRQCRGRDIVGRMAQGDLDVPSRIREPAHAC